MNATKKNKSNSDSKPVTKYVTFRSDEKILCVIDKIAKQQQRPRSNMIKVLLTKAIQEYDIDNNRTTQI